MLIILKQLLIKKKTFLSLAKRKGVEWSLLNQSNSDFFSMSYVSIGGQLFIANNRNAFLKSNMM